MPEPLQAMHDLHDELVANGVASVARGSGILSRFAGWLIGFPPEGDDVPVMVVFHLQAGREHWRRSFGNRSFSSVQEQGHGRNEWLLCEVFGPLKFAMALVLEDDRLRLVVRRWSAFGIPMPRRLAPRINAYEFAKDGRFHFHVEIAHPVTGPIVAYRGWLVRDDASSDRTLTTVSNA